MDLSSEYTDPGASRSMKSSVIIRVVARIREKSAGGYGFVKRDPQTGRWMALEDIAARTTVGQGFRDLQPRQGRSKPSKIIKQAKTDQTNGCRGQVSCAGWPPLPPLSNESTVTDSDVGSSYADRSVLQKLLELLPFPEHPTDNPFEPVPLWDELPGYTPMNLLHAMTYSKVNEI